MDKIAIYRNTIKEILVDKAKLRYANTPELLRKLVISENQDSYILLAYGWVNKRYRHNFVYHVEIISGKVWVHEDNTDVGIAQFFAEKGIPKEDIVLGFLPKFAQEVSDYAVAS